MTTTVKRRSKRKRAISENEIVLPVVTKGMVGGKYKPLSDHEIEQIHQTTLDVLENIGMTNPLPQFKEVALEHGCNFTDQGRLCFPRSLVEDVIARAGRNFVMYGRDPKHDVEMSDKKVHLYGGGEAVTILDLGATTYRPSTINDVYDIEIDKINQPKRPLPQGLVSIKLAISLSLILLFLGLVSSLFISFYNLAIAGLFSLLSWSYNVWGKKNGFIGNSMVALSMAIPFIFGGIITGNLSILTWSISLLAFLSGMGREIIKTISDIEGDRSKGIKSVSITLGPKNAARIASLFFFVAILISFIPIYFNLINFVYLPLLLITDMIFVYSIFKISTDFSQIQALKIKSIILYSMLLGLITFLLNSMILF